MRVCLCLSVCLLILQSSVVVGIGQRLCMECFGRCKVVQTFERGISACETKAFRKCELSTQQFPFLER